MSFCIILRLFLLGIMLISGHTVNSTKTETSMSDIIMDDIENAFKAVTNNTKKLLREKIIPKMYNITQGTSFSFEIPNEKLSSGYMIISMDRSEMMRPIFPNLTMNHEEMILKNRRLQTMLRNSENISKQNTKSNADMWSNLGLEGWTGELANASEFLERDHKGESTVHLKDSLDKRPHLTFPDESFEMDKAFLPLNETKESMKLITFLTNTSTENISKNIYIARANDPFGFSTKWTMRNQTDLNTSEERRKRDIIELYSMIKCATGCEPLTYQSYGCFCGFLGNGIAVDGIDSCCRMHDKCYEQSNCISYLQYFIPYIWKCYHGKPLCALTHGEFGGPTSCAALLCYCDVRLAICLRKFKCPQFKAVCRSSLARQLQNIFF